ncbi:hypothetical protein CRUP_033757 [Coryphaenoides rupestris]|nr:hypothetical protein CRUP_033757 [Coryphaenoides rupestris]
MEILEEKDGVDTELLVYAMTLVNKTLAALPDQDSFYDMVDALEEQGMEAVSQRHLGRRGTDLDLVEQLNIYEATLRHEDGDDDDSQAPPPGQKDRRRPSIEGGDKKCGLERRRSRRASLGRSGPLSPASPQRAGFHHFGGARDASERNPKNYSASGSPTCTNARPALGGLLSSSYRQHQESLAAERERRRVEREERLLRIEREERNKHSRDYVDKMEEARHAREERYKTVERLAAEEYDRGRVRATRARPDANFDPAANSDPAACPSWPSSSRSSPCSFTSQEEEGEREGEGEEEEEVEEEESETPGDHHGRGPGRTTDGHPQPL